MGAPRGRFLCTATEKHGWNTFTGDSTNEQTHLKLKYVRKLPAHGDLTPVHKRARNEIIRMLVLADYSVS